MRVHLDGAALHVHPLPEAQPSQQYVLPVRATPVGLGHSSRTIPQAGQLGGGAPDGSSRALRTTKALPRPACGQSDCSAATASL